MGPNAVEDELEVRNVLGRLARFTDIGSVEEYLEAFTDDAVLEIPGRPIRSGIEELRSGSFGGREAGATGPGSNTMHFLGATTVELDGDTCTARDDVRHVRRHVDIADSDACRPLSRPIRTDSQGLAAPPPHDPIRLTPGSA